MHSKEIGIYIDRTYKIVRQDLITRFKQGGVDMTPEQWVLLSRLDDQKEYSQTDLANFSFKDKPTVSRIVDLLVKKGLVNRKPDRNDKRKFYIRLTAEGRKEVEKARPHVIAAREKGWQNLSKKEYETFVQLMDKIFNNYNS